MVNQELKASDLFVKQRWYKFKKKRADRKNSHLHEWKTDVMAYLEGFYGIWGSIYPDDKKRDTREFEHPLSVH